MNSLVFDEKSAVFYRKSSNNQEGKEKKPRKTCPSFLSLASRSLFDFL